MEPQIKLKINKYENLTMIIPEITNANQLKGFIIRLQKIAKLLEPDIISEPEQHATIRLIPDDNNSSYKLPRLITLSAFKTSEAAQEFVDFINTTEGYNRTLRQLSSSANPKQKLANLKWALRKRFKI